MIIEAGRTKRLTLLGLLTITVGEPIAEEFSKPGLVWSATISRTSLPSASRTYSRIAGYCGVLGR